MHVERGDRELPSRIFLAQRARESATGTRPIRAHIICTDAMSGQSTGAVQRNCVPNCAPVTE